jgi:alternate signal-mediated exported protein, CPF_0494 family
MDTLKKQNMNKKALGLLLGIIALVIIVGTWAYYSSTTVLNNPLETSEYGMSTEEKFTPKDDWQPGDEVEKTVGVTNTGDYDLLVRIKMSEAWTLAGGNSVEIDSSADEFLSATALVAKQGEVDDGLTTDDESVVYKELVATGWALGEDGYWYYTQKLVSEASTGSLLKSITLAANTDMGSYIHTTYYTTATTKPDYDEIGDDPSIGWTVYTGDEVPEDATYSRAVSEIDTNAPGYAAAKYVLTIETETLQATKAAFEGTASWMNYAPTTAKDGWGLE